MLCGVIALRREEFLLNQVSVDIFKKYLGTTLFLQLVKYYAIIFLLLIDSLQDVYKRQQWQTSQK